MCLNFSRKFYVGNYLFSLAALLYHTFTCFVCVLFCFQFLVFCFPLPCKGKSYFHFTCSCWVTLLCPLPSGCRDQAYTSRWKQHQPKRPNSRTCQSFPVKPLLSLEGKPNYAKGYLSLVRLVPKFPDLFLAEHWRPPPRSLALPSGKGGVQCMACLFVLWE